MKIGNFDISRKVLVVAEVGNNHEGSYALAEELVGLAKDCGADAVKFQTFLPERYVSYRDEARFQRLKSFQLSFSQFERLAAHSRRAGIIFFSTPFDLESAEFLASICPALKIASGDNTFIPLIEKIAGFRKPMIISSGLADLATIRAAKVAVERVWAGMGESDAKLAVLHCVSAYPAPPAEANLLAIPYLKQKLGCAVGYSDHTIGNEAATLSVALGARIVEKHFTKSKTHSTFRDHQLSADAADLKALIEHIRRAETMLGIAGKRIQECERDAILASRRSIVAARDLPLGAVVTYEDLAWTRPGGGLSPGRESLLVGKKLKKEVTCGDQFSLDQFGGE